MTPKGRPRTRPITAGEIQVRAGTACKYLEAGQAVMGQDPAERQVAAALAVLAAIAASDAICGRALGEYARGQDHDQAGDLLKGVRPDGPALAKHLARVLEHKSNAHYGTSYLTPDIVESMLNHAEQLVSEMNARFR